jgi:enoyl-CoA hydratase/carnithine racemase
LYEAKKAGGEKLKFLDAFFREEYTIDYQLAQMLPTQISVLDGIVMGGGVGLSANSPI